MQSAHRACWCLLAALLVVAPLSATAGLPDFTDLVAGQHRAVVNISTSRELEPQRGDLPPGLDLPEPGDSPLGELYRRFFGDDERPPVRRSASLGSGFIISPDGYVLTNAHVVADADEIVVRLYDGRQFEAELIGRDERSDVALLKIEAEGLPSVDIGKPRALEVGEWVLAIGSPFGFDHSVTAGIVSAKGRSLPTDSYVPFIQTDVAINPGNSGGPLFNLDGEVVGVNAQIFSRTGGFMGLSFAIPIDVAMEVADQLRRGGTVERGWLGVIIQRVTRDLAESFGMQRARGALVARVLSGSPAEKAGLQVGDVIVAVNARPVAESSALPAMVGRMDVGSKALVRVIRDGEPATLRVTIGRLPTRDALAHYGEDSSGGDSKSPEAASPPGARLGLRVGPVDQAVRQELEIGSGGVAVVDAPGDPARGSGLRAGDVIVLMDARPIKGVADFGRRVAALSGGRSVALLIERADGPRFVTLRVPREDGGADSGQ